ncbi:MAG: DUF1194 domain-containing protein [Rhizobiaceae bacterium]
MLRLVAASALLVWSALPANAITVDLELVLAVDVSMSMDPSEVALQREGYMEALGSREVIEAILQNGEGRIAITYMEWAGQSHSRFAVPWTLIDSPEAALHFLKRLAMSPPSRVDRTSISSALLAAGQSFEDNGFEGYRRVIDISGDGPNNQGDALPGIRNWLVDQGIVINGLALMYKKGSRNFGIDNLDDYYRNCVAGGHGSFVLPVRTRQGFALALKRKLLQEITNRQLPNAVETPRFLSVSMPVSTGDFDCQVGEKIWKRFIDQFGGGIAN